MRIRRLYLVLLFVLVAAVFVVLPGKSVYALGQGSCAVVINSNASGGLAVRTVPSTSSSTLIYRMPDGTKVRITGSSITFGGYTWWPHRGSNGISGWSAGAYLQETSNCTGVSAYTAANQLSQQVKLRNGQWVAASNVSGSEPVIYLDSILANLGSFLYLHPLPVDLACVHLLCMRPLSINLLWVIVRRIVICRMVTLTATHSPVT
ncbi:MAG: SH3 domain-containing protein [Chloroflexi bacterium]|nr:SH3 domain-containing protein [Chloroflexota bacterium]